MFGRSMVMIAGMVLVASGFAAGDPAKGKTKYMVCVACHAENGEGNKVLNSPAIAGQEDWYLTRQLKYFKDGIRGTNPKDIYGMQMRPMAMTLPTDADIADVVAHIKTFKSFKPTESTTGGDAAKGKALYVICATCHGQNAEGNKVLNAPRLNNQHDWYMVTQLKNYKQGIRGKDPKDIYGMQMAPMTATLTDDQAIKDVVAYIMSLAKK